MWGVLSEANAERRRGACPPSGSAAPEQTVSEKWEVGGAALSGGGWISPSLVALSAGQLGLNGIQDLPFVEGPLGGEEEVPGGRVGGRPVLGGLEEAREVVEREGVVEVYAALPAGRREALERLLEALADSSVDLRVVPDLVERMRLNAGIEELDGLPVILLSQTPLLGWNRVAKRATDILLGGAALLLLSPLLGLIALLVRLTSPGPVLYTQERMGLDGVRFRMYKFRSMRADAERETGAVWAKPGDERRTLLGALLRQTSLDELPQLFNVLKGEMSLVGPRPERPVFVEEFRRKVPGYMLRHKMKSGMTGWAQVNGWRGDTSIEKRIECDLYYIENWSLGLDLKIMWLTLWKGFVSRNAY